ncbi:MAG: ATP-dependent zinc protease [Gammaproteobacteria bacterium]|jgi:hypothetical protein|nr:ATP-dependent zinc protease [Gammaproteobacteria bacterium]
MCFACGAAEAGKPQVAGWVERATVWPDRVSVHAKMDTGARTSSINAANPTFFEKQGSRWVQFSLTTREHETIVLERPLVRIARVKRHFGKVQERPVIELDFCVGRVRRAVEVTLVDRSGLNYQLLVGRNFLEGKLLVDAGRSYVLGPACAGG